MDQSAGIPQRRLLRAQLVFFALFMGAAVIMHWPWLNMPPHWDEMGWFLPAALDLYRGGHWIPVSTPPSSHPPGVAAYLAGVWTITSYSIPATRGAMVVLGGAFLFVTFLLAVRLCRTTQGAPALTAAVFLMASPLFHTQSMMAQLDLPAALLTALALLLFLNDRYAVAAVACCALVMVKETGIALPAVFGLWLAKEQRYRDAVWFALPALVLGLWLVALYRYTGHWFGNASFADYNLSYPLHPFRLAAALMRRVYALCAADFHWLGTLAIIAGFRKRLFHERSWKVAASVVAIHVVLVSVVGGAQLERYLLPVWPIFYIAAALGFSALGRRLRALGPAAMTCGLLAGWWIAPPYPYPYENNLGVATFVDLHRTAASFLERNQRGARVATAWPLSDALLHPDFGYVRRPLQVRPVADFRPSSLAAVPAAEFDLLVLYSREWEPRYNWMRVGWIERLWQRYFDYHRPMTVAECEQRFGLGSLVRWESGGQWIEILTR